MGTPPLKNNMEPENHQIEKEDDIPQTLHFLVPFYFRECNWVTDPYK